ncbi:MAG TPA: AAA family ATPase, partial [Acidimicrobiales bacterium]|nr:AAA family ATPase [Acidimicrobiales bacterium]
MFLKSLTLKGFKSFADPTTLDFEPGVTVVVGPNGSGKSNVVDAVAWVLGAQGPRTVRSGKMEDVIFAGTGSRPALGRAEVSLTIDNGAGLLPIELTEVTITRTLFRSGDSEYAINGVPCRLLDIQELLSDSGVGRQQHVIVGQGQLDSVLNARPEERRLIIEEAAGVLKFRRRRERAQRRLDSTEANLTRLTDLLREVRRQLRPLERQAEAARRHAELAGEVAALRLHVAGRELAALEGRLSGATEGRRLLAEEDRRIKAALAELDSEVSVAERAVSATPVNEELSELLGRLEGARQRARGLLALLAERRRSIERDLAASRDEGVVASLEADAAALTSQLAEVEGSALSLVVDADRVAEAEQSARLAREGFTSRWGEEDSADQNVAEAATVRARLAGYRSALRDYEADRRRHDGRRSSLHERLSRLDERHAAAEAGLRAAGDAVEALASRLAEAE